MRFLFLVASLAAGAFVGWMSILGGIWFTMPIFLICAAIVCIALDKTMRWRLAAFSVGMFAMFAFQVGEFVTQINDAQHQVLVRAEQKRLEDLRKKQTR